MNQINNFHNSESQQNLDLAFDRLESLLREKLSNKKDISQYQAEIKLLNQEKKLLNQQLIEKANECNNWKETCYEVINRLNFAIENVKAILKKEQISE